MYGIAFLKWRTLAFIVINIPLNNSSFFTSPKRWQSRNQKFKEKQHTDLEFTVSQQSLLLKPQTIIFIPQSKSPVYPTAITLLYSLTALQNYSGIVYSFFKHSNVSLTVPSFTKWCHFKSNHMSTPISFKEAIVKGESK